MKIKTQALLLALIMGSALFANGRADWEEEFKAYPDSSHPLTKRLAGRIASVWQKQSDDERKEALEYLEQFCRYYSDSDRMNALSESKKRLLIHLREFYLNDKQ